MTATIIIGTQFGDEGKGKIIDYLADGSDIIARFQGGNNAGHTLVVGDETFKLHLIPSGVLHDDKTVVIGSGVVIDIRILCEEIDELKKRGHSVENLKIAGNAHVIMPWHRALDNHEESRRKKKIGTTGRGIGPAYMFKAGRSDAIRIYDFKDDDRLKKKIKEILEKNRDDFMRIGYGQEEKALIKEYTVYAKNIRHYICDVSDYLNNSLDSGKKVLFEGAQGTLLDIDHGTFPFVTSSNTIAAAACTGSGIGPGRITEILGVVKAYTTRVGEGPFPTELDNETGENLRKNGHEFGTTTGRPRRCGWLDLVMLNYAKNLNSLTGIVITKLDVLTGLEKIKVCTGYMIEKKETRTYPKDPDDLKKAEPLYKEFNGWTEDITGIKNYKDLPQNAKIYLDFIKKNLAIPIKIISVGPKRDETIVV
ncbi:MAG: adenylosuccinate synthase [archaeon]